MTGTPDDHAYFLATYSTLTGGDSTFASVTGVPDGYVIDYRYNAGNRIALVKAIPGTILIVR